MRETADSPSLTSIQENHLHWLSCSAHSNRLANSFSINTHKLPVGLLILQQRYREILVVAKGLKHGVGDQPENRPYIT